MDKKEFQEWLTKYYGIQGLFWYKPLTDDEKRAVKRRWFDGLKQFEMDCLRKAGTVIRELIVNKPKWENEHYDALLDQCRKLTPCRDIIHIYRQPSEAEKEKLRATTKKCRQIVRQLKISKMVGEDGPGDKNSGNGSTESPLGDSPTEAKSEAQIATTPEEGEKSVDWDKMAREVAQLAETPDIPF